MKIKKAIFPVGGLGTRFLPATKAMPKEMLPIVDKPLIQYAVEEAANAGIEEFIFVTGRNKSSIEDHFDHSTELEQTLSAKNKIDALKLIKNMMRAPGSVSYVRQQDPSGLGHAIWCARNFVHNEPVAVLLADDLILGKSAISEMIENYESGNMVSIMEIEKKETKSYGIIKPSKISGKIIDVEDIVEKPDINDAPSNLAVVGRYIIEPGVFDYLSNFKKGAGGEIQLTDALADRIKSVPLRGLVFSGRRFDCGSKIGFLTANIAFAMERKDIKDPLKNWIKSYFNDKS